MDGAWHRVCAVGDVQIDDLCGVEVDGRRLVVVRLDDGHHALDAICTHGKADLAEGFVIDGELECPKHNGRFAVTTGEPLTRPVTVGLQSYPCRVTDGVVEVLLPT